jgi:hypothetical protein
LRAHRGRLRDKRAMYWRGVKPLGAMALFGSAEFNVRGSAFLPCRICVGVRARGTLSAFSCPSGGARTITEAAYRFVRHEPGVDVVLFGTGNPQHLRENIAALWAPPLPPADRQPLTKLFGHLVGVGLDRRYGQQMK